MAVAEKAPPHRNQGVAAESAASAPSSPPVPLPPQVNPRQPLLYAALSFSAGILLGTRVWRPATWWAVALVVFLAASGCLIRRRPSWSFALACGALVLLGAFVIQGSGPPAVNTEILRFADGEEVTLIARVTRDGFRREGGFGGERQVVEVESEQVKTAAAQEDMRAGVRLTIYSRAESHSTAKPAPMPLYTYGQRLRLTAKLRPPHNFGNPGAFDYRGYLAQRGIAALGSANQAAVQVLPGFSGNRSAQWRNRLRRSVLAQIHALWPPAQAALIDAMVLGEDAFIDRDTRVNFQRSGTYHILVVSGMNLGILAFVVFWALRRLRVGDLWASVATALLGFGYAYLCDWGAPIVRSALMLLLYLVTRLFYRDRAPVNAVAGAGLGILILDPRALLEPSFQLTFLSVLAIAGIGVPILDRTSQPYRRALRLLDAAAYDLSFAPRLAQFRLDLRMVAGRLGRFLGTRAAGLMLPESLGFLLGVYEVMLISVLMQISLALPMAWYFHRATTLALPANALAIPLTEILMPASALAVALAYVSLTLARLPALIAGLALQGITGTIHIVGSLRLADLRVATPSLEIAVLAALSLALALALARRRRWLAATGLSALLASALWITLVPPRPRLRPGTMEVTAIDVGQGDSTLLVLPQGKTLLIDAGGPFGAWRSEFDYGEDVVSPYLWQRGLARLDAVAITHSHSDHLGGVPSVLANFRPRELWLGPNPRTRALEEVLATARRQNVALVRLRGDDDFAFGGVQVRVLSPPPGWQPAAEPRNNDSLVLRFAYGGTAFLLEGDAESKMELAVAAQHPQAGLLKVAHNGSASSTSPALLAAVRPVFAFISVGARNPFRHPRPEVLNRLQMHHVATYRTDQSGAVTFYLDGAKVTPAPLPR
ncbi:MAG TPA: ComEC/Rec2 family competence protein [Terriglobales bacterium]|nr:ComEC/Rec2 family competence protein [Terriglobales bacterium]